jgi:hypothetical protein
MNYIRKVTFLLVASFFSLQAQSSIIEIEFIANATSANYDIFYPPSTLTPLFESKIRLAFNIENRNDSTFSESKSSRFDKILGESPMSDLMNVGDYDRYDPLNSSFDIRQGYPLWLFPNPLNLDGRDEPRMSKEKA